MRLATWDDNVRVTTDECAAEDKYAARAWVQAEDLQFTISGGGG